MVWPRVNKKKRITSKWSSHAYTCTFLWMRLHHIWQKKNVHNVFSISEVEKRWAGPVLDSVDAPQFPPNVRRRSRDTSSITSQRISQLAHRISAFVDEGTQWPPTNKHACIFLVCMGWYFLQSVSKGKRKSWKSLVMQELHDYEFRLFLS